MCFSRYFADFVDGVVNDCSCEDEVAPAYDAVNDVVVAIAAVVTGVVVIYIAAFDVAAVVIDVFVVVTDAAAVDAVAV